MTQAISDIRKINDKITAYLSLIIDLKKHIAELQAEKAGLENQAKQLREEKATFEEENRVLKAKLKKV